MDRNALAELLQALESRRDAEERRREERYTALIERDRGPPVGATLAAALDPPPDVRTLDPLDMQLAFAVLPSVAGVAAAEVGLPVAESGAGGSSSLSSCGGGRGSSPLALEAAVAPPSFSWPMT
ncbi:UNVERIFIED_CONTAM: hypothetical protein FKN15_028825 [Acipenser sinensis]